MDKIKFKSSIEKHEINEVPVVKYTRDSSVPSERKELQISNRRDALIQEMKDNRSIVMARKDKMLGEIGRAIPYEMDRAMPLIDRKKEMSSIENKKKVLKF